MEHLFLTDLTLCYPQTMRLKDLMKPIYSYVPQMLVVTAFCVLLAKLHKGLLIRVYINTYILSYILLYIRFLDQS